MQLASHLDAHASVDVITLDNLAVAKAQLVLDTDHHAEQFIIKEDQHAIAQHLAEVENVNVLESSNVEGGNIAGGNDHVTHDQLFRR